MILSGIVIKKRDIVKFPFFIALTYLFYLMLLITVQYFPIRLNVAFLQIKQDEIINLHYQIAFFTHVYTSIFVLFLGILQFSKYLRKKYSEIHRSIGKFYIGLILFLSGPSGLVMGFYANGGWITQISFCLLAILWMAFTFKAYQYARERNWVLHRNFMFRSYALTLSAISLRLFKWIIVHLFELPPMDTYMIVSWLGWTLNLLVAEIIIVHRFKKSGISKNTDLLAENVPLKTNSSF